MANLRVQRDKLTTPSPDDSFTTVLGTLRQVDSIVFFESTRTHSWLSFFPHRWAGVLGLIGVLFIFATTSAILNLLFYQPISRWP